jgi:predicted nucleic acid-binding protein
MLLDTGPLVAYLIRQDACHDWANSVLFQTSQPLLTCEAVLTEACHILRNTVGAPEAVIELVVCGAIRVAFGIGGNARQVHALMRKYGDLPMSLADACLVRMAETAEDPTVITLDGHFQIYRIHGRRVIPTIMPPGK